jgi:hypothetical protein
VKGKELSEAAKSPAVRNTQKAIRFRCMLLLIDRKNGPKEHFFDKKLKQDIILGHFVRNARTIQIKMPEAK